MAIKFVTDFLKTREGVKKYTQQLNTFSLDQKLSEQEKQELDHIVSEYTLNNKNLFEVKKSAFISTYNKLTKDERLPEDRMALLQDLLNYFGLDMNEVGLNLNLFRKYVNLAIIDSGTLPDVTHVDVGHNPNIIYKPNEVLHYRAPSLLRKLKHVTKAIQYSGPVASIRIMRGLRYRAGNLNLHRTTVDVLAIEDRGIFYITNQRVGYHGQQKQFSIAHEKISSLELRPNGLYLFKDGKEQPYILSLDDYDVPLAMTSFILNKNDKETK